MTQVPRLCHLICSRHFCRKVVIVDCRKTALKLGGKRYVQMFTSHWLTPLTEHGAPLSRKNHNGKRWDYSQDKSHKLSRQCYRKYQQIGGCE